jgi:nitric oxide reductase NorQ protein
MPATTALIADMLKMGDRNVTRQMVFVKDPTRDEQFQVLTRQLTTSATAKHWKRWPIAGTSIDNTPDSWLSEYATMHGTRDFALSAVFVVEVTASEWDELTADATPRALMIRIDRAREAVGAGMFHPEGRFAASTPDMLTTGLLTQVADWRAASTPDIAPSGRARTPRVVREPIVVTMPGTPGTPAVPSDVNTATPVLPGEHIVLADGNVYVARKLDGDLSDVEMLRQARIECMYALLYSLPGTGKTRAAMAAFGESLLTLVGTADTEVSDFVGTYVPTGKAGEFRWVDGPLVTAMDEGRPLLVDEAFLIDTRTMSVLYSAIDGRRKLNVTSNPARGTVTAKEGFYVIFASNPDVAGARVSEALLSRCALQVEYSTDFAAMEALGVPRTFVVAAKNLNTKRLSQEISTSPQARECIAYRDLCEKFGETFALRNVVASAPEADRDVVADVLSRAFGREIKPLTTQI